MPLEPYSNEFKVPKPEEKAPIGLPEEEASDLAYYTASTAESNDPVEVFELVNDELRTKGSSNILDSQVFKYTQEQQPFIRDQIIDMIGRDDMSKEDKMQAISLYERGDFLNTNLKQKYIEMYGSTSMSDLPDDQDGQTENTKTAKENLTDSELDAESDSLDELFDTAYEYYSRKDIIDSMADRQIMGAVDLEAFVKGFIPFVYSTGRSLYSSVKQYLQKSEVDWEEAKQFGEQGVEDLMELIKSKNYLSGFDWRVAELAKRHGVYDTYEEYGAALSEDFAGKMDEMLDHIAEKTAEKEILGIKDKNQARIFLDSLLIAGPKLTQQTIRGGKYLYGKRTRTGELLDPDQPLPSGIKDITPDGPLDVTIQTNPRAGSQLAIEVLKDETGQFGKIVKAAPEEVVGTYVMPKFNEAFKEHRNVPDIGFRYEEIYPMEYFTDLRPEMRQALGDTLFDANVMSPTKRLKDIEIRRNIAQNEGSLHYHAPLSVINVFDDSVVGKQVYTARPDYPYFRVNDAVEAANRLIDKIERTFPKEERGKVSIVDVYARPPRKFSNDQAFKRDKKLNDPNYPKRLQVEWNYEHKWNPLSTIMDPLAKPVLVSVLPGWTKVPFLGKDRNITAAVQGKFIGDNFVGANRFADWVQAGMANNALKALYLEEKGLQAFREKILSTPKKVQGALQEVFDKQQRMGIDTFDMLEIDSMYNNVLNPKQRRQLYEGQIAWRQTQDFIHQLVNIAYKNEMKGKGFDKALMSPDGKMITLAKEKFSLPEKLDDVVIWDYDLADRGAPVSIGTPKKIKGKLGWYTAEGKQIVMLPERGVEMPGNVYYRYATFGEKVSIDIMPQTVVPKVPGYSPRRTKGHFFIDEIPLKATVDGIVITDKAILAEQFRKAVGSSRFKKGAKDLVRAFEAADKEGNYRYVERQAKEERLADSVSEFNFHDEMIAQARKRGESLKGDAPLERMDVLTQELVGKFSRHQAYRQYDTALEKSFIDQYGDLLPNKRFPLRETDIRDLTGASTELRVKQAKALYRQIQFYRSSGLGSLDKGVQDVFHGIANILEDSSFAKSIAPITRDLGNLGIGPYNYIPRQLASLLFISLQMPLRQWLVQTAQLTELAVAFPKESAVAYRALPFVTLKLFSDATALKPFKKVFDSEAYAKLSGYSAAELNSIVRAMESQGVKHAVDSNILVREMMAKGPTGLQQAWDKSMVENTTNAIKEYLGKGARGVGTGVRFAAGVGFGAGEMANRIGTWLVTYQLEKGKGSFTLSPEKIAEISGKTDKRAGSPTKAGSTPAIQLPVLGQAYQFINIIKNLQNNLFIKDAVKLTNAERGRLTMAGGVMNGLVQGIPALGLTGLIYNLMEETMDLEPEVRMALWSGVYDLALASDNVHSSTNKYGDTGFWVWDVIQASMTTFGIGQGSTLNPSKFPAHVAASRVFKTYKEVEAHFATKDISEFNADDWMMLGKFLATTTSFGANYDRYEMLKRYKDGMSKSGQPLGIQISTWEATLALAGILPKDFDLVYKEEAAKLSRDDQKRKDTAFINNYITHNINKYEEETNMDLYRRRTRALNLLLNMYKDKYTTAELKEMKKDALYAVRPTRKSKLETLTQYWYQNISQENNKEFQRLENRLRYIKPELGPMLDKLEELKKQPQPNVKESQRDYEFIKKENEGK